MQAEQDPWIPPPRERHAQKGVWDSQRPRAMAKNEAGH